MTEFIVIIVAAALANNYVLVQFLGASTVYSLPLGSKLEPAIAFGIANLLIIVGSGALNYLLYHALLVPTATTYLYLVMFMLINSLLVVLLDAIWQRLHQSSYLPLKSSMLMIAINTCVLGSTLISLERNSDFLITLAQALGAGLGFLIVMVLLSAMRIKLSDPRIPAPFQGSAIAIISAGLLALGFLGFVGIV
ncbi:MAG: Rnf-Nqr domain containing protein [Pseudohongiellaceae bacterium]|nr:Rnf-Nqr domain containing protein [Pseudohongiellaceae bacterium]